MRCISFWSIFKM